MRKPFTIKSNICFVFGIYHAPLGDRGSIYLLAEAEGSVIE